MHCLGSITLAVSGAHVLARWLHHPLPPRGSPTLSARTKVTNSYLTLAVWGPTCGNVATSPVLSRGSPNAQRGVKITNGCLTWLPSRGPIYGQSVGKHFGRNRFLVGKTFVEKCGAIINKHCHFPVFPHPIPPFFLVAKWGQMGIARPSHDIPQQKKHFLDFWPTISPFFHQNPKMFPIPLISPIFLFFPTSRIVSSVRSRRRVLLDPGIRGGKDGV